MTRRKMQKAPFWADYIDRFSESVEAVKEFRQKYPGTFGVMEEMEPEEVDTWIKAHPNIVPTPKRLVRVSFEKSYTELSGKPYKNSEFSPKLRELFSKNLKNCVATLTLIIDPIYLKLVDSETSILSN